MGNKEIKAASAKDIEVVTFSNVDLSDIRVPMIAVYEHPADYPGYCIGRIFNMDRPTNIIIKKDSVEEIRKDIHAAFHHTASIRRGEADVKTKSCKDLSK